MAVVIRVEQPKSEVMAMGHGSLVAYTNKTGYGWQKTNLIW